MKKVINLIGKATKLTVCLFVYFSVARLSYTIAVNDVHNFGQVLFFLVFVAFLSFLIYVSAVLMLNDVFKTK